LAESVVFVEGAGGSIHQITLPPKGTVRRGILDDQLKKGDLVIVDAADVEQVAIRGGGTAFVRRGASPGFRGLSDGRGPAPRENRHLPVSPGPDAAEVTRYRLARINQCHPSKIDLA
jgi:hypothetical protein